LTKANALHRFALLSWLSLALALTMLPKSVPLIDYVTDSFFGTTIGATIGHAGLFGMLGLLLYFVLQNRLSKSSALMVAVLVALVLGTGTEVYQVVLADRDAALTDLLANWLGVFVVGFAVSYMISVRRMQ
jgi:hypothetical protein